MPLIYLKPKNTKGFLKPDFSEKPQDLHITLFYFEELTESEEFDTKEFLKNFAKTLMYIPVKYTELFRFEKVKQNKTDDVKELTDAVCLKVKSQELLDIRHFMSTALDGMGFKYSKKFEYKPHVTISYVPHGNEVELDIEFPREDTLFGLYYSPKVGTEFKYDFGGSGAFDL